jgi:hypothetical protein
VSDGIVVCTEPGSFSPSVISVVVEILNCTVVCVKPRLPGKVVGSSVRIVVRELSKRTCVCAVVWLLRKAVDASVRTVVL